MPEYIITGMTPKPKKRPIQGRGGMYMPRDYTDWKSEVRANLASFSPTVTDALCRVEIAFHGPSKPRGDLDNLAGAILDAIQPPRAKGNVNAQRALEASTTLEQRLVPGCLIVDDKQVIDLRAHWVKGKERKIVIRLEEVA